MKEDDVLKAATLIKARQEIEELLGVMGDLVEGASILLTLSDDKETTCYTREENPVPLDILILGLHRMAEECRRQITLLGGE